MRILVCLFGLLSMVYADTLSAYGDKEVIRFEQWKVTQPAFASKEEALRIFRMTQPQTTLKEFLKEDVTLGPAEDF